MKATDNTSAPSPADSAFAAQLSTALRGGAIMLAGLVLWEVPLQGHGAPFFQIWFSWLLSAWLVFPVGALLGCLLPGWVARRGLAAALGIGALVGIIAGLSVALGVWLCLSQQELTGLVANRGSGGYASYSYSVRLQLRDQAWRTLTGLAPLAAAWVAVWTVWTNRFSRFSPAAPGEGSNAPGIVLRLDRHLLRLVAWLAAGFAVFATAAILLASLTARSAHVSAANVLIVGPSTAGLVALGPWLGPLLNPGGGSAEAWKWTAMALPVLLGGVAPFAFWRRPVRPTTAVVAWCGLVTALLFWSAAGALSLGWSLG